MVLAGFLHVLFCGDMCRIGVVGLLVISCSRICVAAFDFFSSCVFLLVFCCQIFWMSRHSFVKSVLFLQLLISNVRFPILFVGHNFLRLRSQSLPFPLQELRFWTLGEQVRIEAEGSLLSDCAWLWNRLRSELCRDLLVVVLGKCCQFSRTYHSWFSYLGKQRIVSCLEL